MVLIKVEKSMVLSFVGDTEQSGNSFFNTKVIFIVLKVVHKQNSYYISHLLLLGSVSTW